MLTSILLIALSALIALLISRRAKVLTLRQAEKLLASGYADLERQRTEYNSQLSNAVFEFEQIVSDGHKSLEENKSHFRAAVQAGVDGFRSVTAASLQDAITLAFREVLQSEIVVKTRNAAQHEIRADKMSAEK